MNSQMINLQHTPVRGKCCGNVQLKIILRDPLSLTIFETLVSYIYPDLHTWLNLALSLIPIYLLNDDKNVFPHAPNLFWL